MASTYSTNLRLELQTTGENRGSWGTKANNDFNLIEEAITGYELVNMADANQVLTAINGATDQARNMFIKLNGPNTSVRTVRIPAVPKMYFFWNATGASVSIITGGSPTPPLVATYTILNGDWRIIYTDGSAVWSSDDLVSKTASGARWSSTPYTDVSGVTEVGRYVDFHNTDADTTDFGVRLDTNLTTTDLYITPSGGSARKIWNQGNDGAGSGMDADTLDGLHAVDIIYVDAPSNGNIYGRKDGAWVALASGDVGAVTYFARNSPPANYLKANGASVLRSTYPLLFTAIGTTFGTVDSTHFTLPDLRGEFIRGWDDARLVDSSRTFGSFQSDEFQSHTHTATSTVNSGGAHTPDGVADAGGAHGHPTRMAGSQQGSAGTDATGGIMTLMNAARANYSAHTSATPGDPLGDQIGLSATHTHSLTMNAVAAHTHTATVTVTAIGSTETRPRNVALLACIRYQ